MKALLFEKHETRNRAALLASKFSPASAALLSQLRLADIDEPELPGPGWKRITPLLAGISRRDLLTLSGHSTSYFDPLSSYPHVMGHEILGRTDSGNRVVIDSILGHEARGISAPHPGAAPGDGTDHRHLLGGCLEAGLGVGSCESTSGGWAEVMVAHESQLHYVPAELSDETAVMIEPTARAVHAALAARTPDGGTSCVLIGGVIGLATVAALRSFSTAAQIVAAAETAEYRELARQLGADVVIETEQIRRAIRRVTGSVMIGNVLSSGADVVIDTVGQAQSIGKAISVCRPRGRVVLAETSGSTRIDLAPLWHREIELVGAYGYRTEQRANGTREHSFALATELVESAQLARLVTKTYRLNQYKAAIKHAASAPARNTTRILFDMRDLG